VLLSSDGSTAVSNLGWVDKGSLWILSVGDLSLGMVKLGESAYLRLRMGTDDCFTAQHGGRERFDRFEVTVHHLSDPAAVLARVSLEGAEATFQGDTTAWARAPVWYVDYFRLPASAEYRLFRIDATTRRVEHQDFAWYTPQRYDVGYQGVIGVTAIPGDHRLLVSVQRSSTLVLHDPEARAEAGAVTLADRGGNPTVHFLRTRPEAWADDYDTVVRLDARTLRVRDKATLQSAAGNVRQFVGALAFDEGEHRCVVARPYSGDIAVLDVARFKVVGRVGVGGQPLDVALARDGRVFARDWKTGELRVGQFRA